MHHRQRQRVIIPQRLIVEKFILRHHLLRTFHLAQPRGKQSMPEQRHLLHQRAIRMHHAVDPLRDQLLPALSPLRRFYFSREVAIQFQRFQVHRSKRRVRRRNARRQGPSNEIFHRPLLAHPLQPIDLFRRPRKSRPPQQMCRIIPTPTPPPPPQPPPDPPAPRRRPPPASPAAPRPTPPLQPSQSTFVRSSPFTPKPLLPVKRPNPPNVINLLPLSATFSPSPFNFAP